MRLKQSHIEHLQDLMRRGEITSKQANVEKVKMARVQMVINRLPLDVRKALDAAVKRGELGHIKKDGHKPEVYFHPHFEHLAIGERNQRARDVANAAIVMPRVHNKYHRTAPPDAVYIGRGSPYGNPFVIGKDGDRDTVCDKYEAMLLNGPALIAQVKRDLKGKCLVCFCAPKRCHGDTLVRIANEL